MCVTQTRENMELKERAEKGITWTLRMVARQASFLMPVEKERSNRDRTEPASHRSKDSHSSLAPHYQHPDTYKREGDRQTDR